MGQHRARGSTADPATCRRSSEPHRRESRSTRRARGRRTAWSGLGRRIGAAASALAAALVLAASGARAGQVRFPGGVGSDPPPPAAGDEVRESPALPFLGFPAPLPGPAASTSGSTTATTITQTISGTIVPTLTGTGSAGPHPALPAEGPAITDFEEGLGPWVLSGSALRVPSDALGGEWAVFADGGELVGWFFSDDPVDLVLSVGILDDPADTVFEISTGCVGICTTAPDARRFGWMVRAVHPTSTATTLRIPLELTGSFLIGIEPSPRGFIDDLGFVAVPEPALGVLVGGTLVLFAAATRRRRGRRRGPAPDR